MKKKLQGTSNQPRLYIFKSNKHIYAQIIDDTKKKILFSSSSLCKQVKQKVDSSSGCQKASIVGKNIAEQLKQKGINQIVFDRGKKLYHGRIKALANSTRKEGIIF